jgi:ribose 1,5-bisphosphokinase PhnN
MGSTRRQSRAGQAASNVRRRADGGSISAAARNAVTSAAATVRQVNMRPNITRRRVTRSSPASSRARTGFTTIALAISAPARRFARRTRIRWISRRRDRRACRRQTGKRCFTNSAMRGAGRRRAWSRRTFVDASPKIAKRVSWFAIGLLTALPLSTSGAAQPLSATTVSKRFSISPSSLTPRSDRTASAC